MKKARLDKLLVELGLCESADAAARAIIAGDVLVDDVRARSAGQAVSLGARVRTRQKREFASRGGYKLKAGIDAFRIDVAGRKCLDIGASTGGFTDCLLKAGAESVTCVDVGYGQLAWHLRCNPSTFVFERTNIKHADPEELGAPFDVIVIDVSFIGLSDLAKTLPALAGHGGTLLALVKPQFESMRGEAPGGVVLDESVRIRCIEEVKDALANYGFSTLGVMESPIKGPAGNIEYLLHASYM